MSGSGIQTDKWIIYTILTKIISFKSHDDIDVYWDVYRSLNKFEMDLILCLSLKELIFVKIV